MIRTLFFCLLLTLATPGFALTPNLPAGTLDANMVVQTRLGPMNALIDAPRPTVPAVASRIRGVYAIDVVITTGSVYDVRVLTSSGDKSRDAAVVETLRLWRFKPRMIYKLIVPIEFYGKHVIFGAGL
jgi:TonB family protein